MSKTLFNESEIRSGFLIVACTAALLVLLLMAGKSKFFQDSYPVRLKFNFISGLSENAPVNLAGHEIGAVKEILFSGGSEPYVEVIIAVDKKVVLHKDSEAFINVMGFMGETYIELTVGSPSAGVLQRNEILVGTDPVPMMELVKRGTQLMTEFEKSSDSLNKIIESINDILGENTDEINRIFGNVDNLTGGEDTRAILANLNASTENLKDMTSDLKTSPWKLLKKSEE